MDRKIVYPGQIPLETDLLATNQNAMVAISKLAGAIFGTGGAVNGLTVGPNTPAALTVIVAPGEIYQLANLEATAYSSLPADTTHTVVKQGIMLDPLSVTCAAPTTAGFSVNYLIEAAYSEVDTGATVLPFYNASNPSQAYSGPNNSGAQSMTIRAGRVQIQAKQGIAAATGSQVTPAVDTGYIALAVVTVANGQSSVTAANIAAVASPQVLATSIVGMISASRQFRSTTSGSLVVPNTVTTMYLSGAASGAGGGAGGSGSAGTGGVGGGGGGGGAGASLVRQPYAVVPGSTINWTMGAPGAGAPAVSTGGGGTGGSGGSLVISGTGFNGGTPVTLAGGTGGVGGAIGLQIGVGGAGGSGAPNGAWGSDAQNSSSGGGNTNGSGGDGGAGASCPFGGGGGNARGGTSGGVSAMNASGFGAGGGGGGGAYSGLGGTGGSGGAGAPALLIFEW